MESLHDLLLSLSVNSSSASTKNTSTGRCTTFISGIPVMAVAKDLCEYLEKAIGVDIVECRILPGKGSRRSSGSGLVQFKTDEAALKAIELARSNSLNFWHKSLVIRPAKKELKLRAKHSQNPIKNGILYMGCFTTPKNLYMLWLCRDVNIEIDYENKKFKIFLRANLRKYKLEWRFRDIYLVDSARIQNSANRSLLLTVWTAPRIYVQPESGLSDIFVDEMTFISEDDDSSWARTTDFTPGASIGQSFVYCVELPTVTEKAFKDIFSNLKDFKMALFPLQDKLITIQTGDTYSSEQDVVPILSSQHINELPFDLIFQLNSLVQQGYLSGPTLGNDFCHLLKSSCTNLDKTKFLLEKLLRRKETCYDPEKWFKHQLRDLNRKQNFLRSLNEIEDGLVFVRRLVITPCKIFCMGPEVDISNHVIRQYSGSIENFIRVSFVEEDWDYLASTALTDPRARGLPMDSKPGRTKVYNRILSVLKEGVTLGNKKFEFLAFSSSQIRESSVWMFASHHGITAQSIREWMGDFLDIRNVAKCASRMGQCFSSSTKSLDVHRNELQVINDIKRNGYCFSDGIGKISRKFAAKVAKKCDQRRLKGRVPSAFQIRYGGYKGVVAVDPLVSHNCKLYLRPSMEKFPSTHISLDILNWTHPIPCYLNRQIITLLSTLGVADSVFEELQRQAVSQLRGVLENREVALNVLQAIHGGDNLVFEMLQSGYNPCSEPLLQRMLYAFQDYHLMKIRTKARVFVPKGRVLMGCLDETGTLSYGEVFVQVSPMMGTQHQIFNDGLVPSLLHGINKAFETTCIVKGQIIVAKNPCVHPGDIRILKAIDVPCLQHMVDCIVFPQNGSRPHPNECSGSDLDGDLYFVSWDQTLIPPKVDLPTDYHPPQPQQLNHPVTIQEIQEYFVKYMVNDSLGVISNAHMVFADREPLMARDPKCLKLAQLFSLAVDFPKTGVPAILPMELRPKEYPDFMEKDDKVTYRSARVLGKLYRSIKEFKKGSMEASFTREDAKTYYDRDLEVPGYERYLEEALVDKRWYDEKLSGLMNQYGINTEAEILTGFVVGLSSFYRRRQNNVKERVQKAMDSLIKETYNWFYRHGDLSEDEDEEDSRGVSEMENWAKASAWHHVTYHPNYVDLSVEGGYHLLSFPWVVHGILLQIKKCRHPLR